eukprot:5801688-Amphidinium_carterae.1
MGLFLALTVKKSNSQYFQDVPQETCAGRHARKPCRSPFVDLNARSVPLAPNSSQGSVGSASFPFQTLPLTYTCTLLSASSPTGCAPLPTSSSASVTSLTSSAPLAQRSSSCTVQRELFFLISCRAPLVSRASLSSAQC